MNQQNETDCLLAQIDLKNYPAGGTVFRRTAARALIQKGDQYVMIRSEKYGEYKFPGGGVNEGETPREAMIREVSEETGLTVREDSIRYLGRAEERRKGQTADRMEMISHYYICETDDVIGEQNLDEYEKEYGYQLRYVTLAKAIEHNRQIQEIESIPWIVRDTKVMEYLLKQEQS